MVLFIWLGMLLLCIRFLSRWWMLLSRLILLVLNSFFIVSGLIRLLLGVMVLESKVMRKWVWV